MTMRALCRSIIVNSLEPGFDIPAERWFGSGAVPDDPPSPFAEIRISTTNTGMGILKRGRVEVWVHDSEGSYVRIDQILDYVEQIYGSTAHASDPLSGAEIVQFGEPNRSPDLYDDGYRTNCRMAAFDVIGRDSST